MKAVIMAGGAGSRLRPLTCDRPKPMMGLFGRPVMEYALEGLKAHGITEVAVTLHYMAEDIRGYFGDGRDFGVDIRYFTEDKPLGTAGSVKAAAPFLDGDFLVLSGDALCDIDYSAAIEAHYKKGGAGTLVLSCVNEPLSYGVVVTGEGGRITGFVEKPDWPETMCDTVNTGIYILNREVLDEIPENTPYDFSCDLFPRLIGGRRGLFGWRHDGYWCDIGDCESYRRCHFDMLDGRVKNPLWPIVSKKGKYRPSNINIAEPCYIEGGTVIADGCQIGPYAVIEGGVSLMQGCGVKRSVIQKGCTAGPRCEIKGAVLAEGVIMKEGAACFEGSVIGAKTVVGAGARIMPSVRVWPGKRIEEGAYVSRNLVWGASGEGFHLTRRGLLGRFNTEITPELCVRAGMVLSHLLERGEVGVGDDAKPQSRLLREAICIGLCAGGRRVNDIGECGRGVLGHSVSVRKMAGGVYISSDGEETTVEISGADGLPLPKGKMRAVAAEISRDDCPRPPSSALGRRRRIYGMEGHYIESLKEALPIKRGVRLCLDADESPEGSLARSLTAAMGVTLLTPGRAAVEGAPRILVTGNTMAVKSPGGGELMGEELFSLACAVFMELFPGKRLLVPVWAPASVLREGAARGTTVEIFCDGGRPPSVDDLFFLRLTRCNSGILALILFGLSRGVDIFALARRMGGVHVKRRTVPCPQSAKARVMRELTRSNAHLQMLGEGLRIEAGDGFVIISPHISRPLCTVYAQDLNMETAAELCDFYEKKVESAAAQNDEN